MDMTPNRFFESLNDVHSTTYRFPYPYLPSDGQHFRLLQLYGDKVNSPIQCELFTARRSDWKEQYFAMSYVWGPQDDLRNINVNNIGFTVGRNLHDFLLNFRRYMKTHELPWAIIWIDAICIDQGTTNEKNHQVQVMSGIFQDSACVFSWLGRGYTTIEDLVKSIGNIRTATDPEKPIPLFEAAREFEALEYWTRLWVVPEIILARNQIYIYGEAVCSKASLLHFLEWAGMRRIRAFFVHEFELSRLKADPPNLLSSLFGTFGCLGCSLDHDRIFALLGICNIVYGQHWTQLRVDYDMSRTDLLAHSMPKRTDPHPVEAVEEDAIYVQNFLFAIGLSVDEVNRSYTVLVESLPPFMHIGRCMTSWTTAWTDEWPLTCDGVTIAHIKDVTLLGAPGTRYGILFDTAMSVIPFEADFRVERPDMICLQPANLRFPVEYARLYSTGYLLRAKKSSSFRRPPLCGIIIRAGLLSPTSWTTTPSEILPELMILQRLGRELSATAYVNEDFIIAGNVQMVRGLQFSTLHYLRFLAQFRHLVLLLHGCVEARRFKERETMLQGWS